MTTERRHHERNRILSPTSLLLCFAGLLAIAFSITLRDIQTTVLPDQLALLHLTPRIFNELNTSNEYTLIVSLILSGLVVDLIGPRTVLTISVVVSMLANCFYCTTDSLQTVLTYRMLTEYSHIFILMSVLTLGSHWLPRRHFSTFAGLLFGVLLLSPVLITLPLKSAIVHRGLGSIYIPMALVGVIIILLIVRTITIPDMTRRRSDIYSHFNPLRYYKIWLIGVVAMIGWMTNIFILGTGVYYLSWGLRFSVSHSIHITSVAFIYFGIGTIVAGIVADFFERKRLLIVVAYCLAALAFSIVIFVPGISMKWVSILLYATAFFAGSNIICYTKANDYCAIENCGIALGLVLSISTIGSSLFSRMIHHGMLKYIYSAPPSGSHDWKVIVMIIPITLLIGALISLLLLHRPMEIIRKTTRL